MAKDPKTRLPKQDSNNINCCNNSNKCSNNSIRRWPKQKPGRKKLGKSNKHRNLRPACSRYQVEEPAKKQQQGVTAPRAAREQVARRELKSSQCPRCSIQRRPFAPRLMRAKLGTALWQTPSSVLLRLLIFWQCVLGGAEAYELTGVSGLLSKQSPWRTTVATNFSEVLVGEAAKPGPAVAHSLDDPEAFDGVGEMWQMEDDFRRSEARTPLALSVVENMILHPTTEQTLRGWSGEDQQAMLDFVAERRREALARRQALQLANGSLGNAELNGTNARDFWPCRKWDGSRPGEAFQLGDSGQGYYIDNGGCTSLFATAMQHPRVIAPVRLPMVGLAMTTVGIFNPAAMAKAGLQEQRAAADRPTPPSVSTAKMCKKQRQRHAEQEESAGKGDGG